MYTNPWLPSGFTYWGAGNWDDTGTTTSGTNDYITTVLPKSGKYYWETKLTAIASAQVFGIGVGASGAGTGYENDLIGYYYNGPVPLFLTRTGAGDHGDAVSHGTTTGTTWEVGKKLMWAYDPGDVPDTGKVWLGYNGTWYGSGDPAAGTNPSISGADLSPANSGTNYHLKIGYSDGGGPTNLTNVQGSSSLFTATTVVQSYNQSKQLLQSTAGNTMTPVFSSIADGQQTYIPKNHTLINPVQKSTDIHNYPRPASGQMYPRGNRGK